MYILIIYSNMYKIDSFIFLKIFRQKSVLSDNITFQDGKNLTTFVGCSISESNFVLSKNF